MDRTKVLEHLDELHTLDQTCPICQLEADLREARIQLTRIMELKNIHVKHGIEMQRQRDNIIKMRNNP